MRYGQIKIGTKAIKLTHIQTTWQINKFICVYAVCRASVTGKCLGFFFLLFFICLAYIRFHFLCVRLHRNDTAHQLRWSARAGQIDAKNCCILFVVFAIKFVHHCHKCTMPRTDAVRVSTRSTGVYRFHPESWPKQEAFIAASSVHTIKTKSLQYLSLSLSHSRMSIELSQVEQDYIYEMIAATV